MPAAYFKNEPSAPESALIARFIISIRDKKFYQLVRVCYLFCYYRWHTRMLKYLMQYAIS